MILLIALLFYANGMDLVRFLADWHRFIILGANMPCWGRFRCEGGLWL
jgi:hypothetical protein